MLTTSLAIPWQCANKYRKTYIHTQYTHQQQQINSNCQSEMGLLLLQWAISFLLVLSHRYIAVVQWRPLFIYNLLSLEFSFSFWFSSFFLNIFFCSFFFFYFEVYLFFFWRNLLNFILKSEIKSKKYRK